MLKKAFSRFYGLMLIASGSNSPQLAVKSGAPVPQPSIRCQESRSKKSESRRDGKDKCYHMSCYSDFWLLYSEFLIPRSLLRGSALAILALSLPLASSNAAEFTADMVQDTGHGVLQGKVFVRGDNLRQEMNLVKTKQIMIFRKDKGVVWMLMPANKMYIEMPATAQARAIHQVDQEKLEKMAKKEYLGKEEVNGYACEKNRYTFHDKPSSIMTQWFSKKLSFPLKMEMEGPSGRVITEYKNLKEKAVSNSLFEIPPGYKKMSMPAMMQGMPGAMPDMPETMPDMPETMPDMHR